MNIQNLLNQRGDQVTAFTEVNNEHAHVVKLVGFVPMSEDFPLGVRDAYVDGDRFPQVLRANNAGDVWDLADRCPA